MFSPRMAETDKLSSFFVAAHKMYSSAFPISEIRGTQPSCLYSSLRRVVLAHFDHE